MTQKLLRYAGSAEPVFKYLTILCLAAILLFSVVRPMLARVLSHAPVNSVPQMQLPGQRRENPETGDTHAEHGPQALFQKVVDHIQRDPAQSARILQTWMKAE